MLPEQGQHLAQPACSSAFSRRHGAAASSARSRRQDRLTLPAGGGYMPALVATVGLAMTAGLIVATTTRPPG